MKAATDDACGFTLLETLIALVVLGCVVVGLAQGLRFGLGAWDHQSRIIDRDGALDTTDRSLRTLIAGMAPAADPRVPSIHGTRESLAFITALPGGAVVGPMRLADVVLGVDAAHRLVLRWSLHLHARLLAPQPARQAVLLPGISSLTLAYFHPATERQAAGWVDQWQSADPPARVRIHLAFVDPAFRWPDVIVEPMRRRDNE
jgi:prepilin-type N-terminal cleavage/methylation domain-containing protein